MNFQADFIEGEIVKFQEVQHKQPDLHRYQGAMFLDRPDLWPTKRRPKKSTALPGQQPLFEEGD
jgi:hypothetical protein